MGCYNTGLGSFQKWAIGNVIRDILISDEKITSQIGNKIFPVVASEDTKGDFIVYRRTQYSKASVKMGVYEDKCEVSLIIISDNYNNSVQLAADVDNAITGKHTIDGIRVDMMLSNSSEDYEDDKYIQILTFTIK